MENVEVITEGDAYSGKVFCVYEKGVYDRIDVKYYECRKMARNDFVDRMIHITKQLSIHDKHGIIPNIIMVGIK